MPDSVSVSASASASTSDPDPDPAEDAGPGAAFARSAAARSTPAADVADWLAQRAKAHDVRVDRIEWSALEGWEFDPRTGDLGHRSGRFFTVQGLRVEVAGDPGRSWHQPVINQPESGIVGILAKEFDGVLHFLMQAKMEPGYCNLVQLAPTVQATRSNYSGAHRGAAVRHLEYFLAPRPDDVLVDVLQSAPAAWFLRKTNRTMIVRTADDVPAGADFRWLTLGDIGELLRCDHLVNMDTRTSLGCAPAAPAAGPALHRDAELLSWFTEIRSRRTLTATRVPLAALPGWRFGPGSIEHADGRYFRVVAVAARAAGREVGSWSQPIVEPVGVGVNAFLATRIAGVRHVLAQARVEPGSADEVELAPTVQTVPGDLAPGARRPRFLEEVLTAEPGRIRFRAELSEEGGRLLNARNRYLVVEADRFPEPPGYRWITPGQLAGLAEHSHYVNSQARSLLTCMSATGVG